MLGALGLAVLLVMLVLFVGLASLGLHGLLLGRMPGAWLRRWVHHPRIWGAGAVLVAVSWSAHSPSLLVIGIGLVAVGHVAELAP